MTIFVPEKLKELVEGWILQSDRKREMGGTFFGSETEFKSFLPIPNFSEKPQSEFSKGNAQYYEREFSKLIGYPPIAGMHTHPDGSIPSGNDCKYVQHPTTLNIEIVIADMGNEFRWFGFDKNLKHLLIYFKDIELERAVLSLSQSFGMLDIGRCMVTQKGELLCENEKGKQFLNFDTDTYKVWSWLEMDKNKWNKTKKQIHLDTGLSLKKVNDALVKLGVKELR